MNIVSHPASPVGTGKKPVRPEFHAASRPEDIAHSLQRYGCALLRQVVARGYAERMCARMERAYAMMDKANLSGNLTDPRARGHYFSGHAPMELFAEEGKPPFDFVQQLTPGILRDALRLYFRSPLAVPLDGCVPRRQAVAAPNMPVPYHQDMSFLPRFVQGDSFLINCWIPMSACGTDTPGLEVLPVRLNSLATLTPRNDVGVYGYINVAEETVLNQAGRETLWIPEFQPGDVMLFDPYTLHRTHQKPGMTGTRYSIEIRIGRPQQGRREITL